MFFLFAFFLQVSDWTPPDANATFTLRGKVLKDGQPVKGKLFDGKYSPTQGQTFTEIPVESDGSFSLQIVTNQGFSLEFKNDEGTWYIHGSSFPFLEIELNLHLEPKNKVRFESVKNAEPLVIQNPLRAFRG
ncbi:MAG: hypothetical protein KDC71_07150 [Acidobacteria bacterium]|nr:hypothetical protein [Acidobacteriota bacterium]